MRSMTTSVTIPTVAIRHRLTTIGIATATTGRKALRTARAIFTVTRRHVPAWLGAVLTVCLFIPGPLDELLILLVIACMVGFKPVMRADLTHAVAQAWEK